MCGLRKCACCLSIHAPFAKLYWFIGVPYNKESMDLIWQLSDHQIAMYSLNRYATIFVLANLSGKRLHNVVFMLLYIVNIIASLFTILCAALLKLVQFMTGSLGGAPNVY